MVPAACALISEFCNQPREGYLQNSLTKISSPVENADPVTSQSLRTSLFLQSRSSEARMELTVLRPRPETSESCRTEAPA